MTHDDLPQDDAHSRRLHLTRRRALLVGGILAAVAAMGAVAATGTFSSATPGQTVASLPGHGNSTQSTGPPTATQTDSDFVKFTDCMRAHGVQIADPYHRPGNTGLTLDL